MKMNKKGFTLIELLAVIVILAIIALIATPIVLNIITKARRSAAQDSLYGVMAAARTAYMSTLLDSAQIGLPMTIECDTDECLVYNYDENDSNKKGTAQTYTVTKTDGTEETVQFKVDFSGTVPGTKGDKTKNAYFSIDRDGKVEDATDIPVNGFKCKINKEVVTCS